MSKELPFMWDGKYAEVIKLAPNNEAVKTLLSVIDGKYYLKLRLSHFVANFYVNGSGIVWRDKKTSPVQFGKNVKLLKGTPSSEGGSIKYPRPHFNEGYCEIEVITNGFPAFQWQQVDVEILELKKL